MHREYFDGESELIKKYDKQNYIEQLDEFIKSTPIRRMNLIGSRGQSESAKCDTIKFSDSRFLREENWS